MQADKRPPHCSDAPPYSPAAGIWCFSTLQSPLMVGPFTSVVDPATLLHLSARPALQRTVPSRGKFLSACEEFVVSPVGGVVLASSRKTQGKEVPLRAYPP